MKPIPAIDTPALEMKNISKGFYGTYANKGVNLTVARGHVHALLGENGAGKTTLMNILSGIYKADSGDIFIDGHYQDIRSPRDAIAAGIGMVHQHFRLVRPLTVAENIILGHYTGYIINPKHLYKEIENISEKYNLSVSPSSKIYNLSVGEQQKVEILKALYRGANILILDEPTAVLTPHEAKQLFAILREMTKEGKTVLFISHRLEEVMAVSDYVTVMRKGETIKSLPASTASPELLANIMVGADVAKPNPKREARDLKPGKPLISLTEASTAQEESYGCSLKNISLSVSEGQILGIAGVSGNGQRELAEVLVGCKQLHKGSVYIGNSNMTNRSPKEFIEKGVGYIPADRLGDGLLPNLGAVDNYLLKNYFKSELRSGNSIRYDLALKNVKDIIKEYNIKLPKIEYPAKFLSGGNLQRLLIGRELSSNPKILVAVNPTRGLDIAGVNIIHRILIEQSERGVGIILISEDLDELMQLSDYLSVLYRGCISPVIPRESISLETVAALMGGVGFDTEEQSKPAFIKNN